MNYRKALVILAAIAGSAGALWAFQKPFREYRGMEYSDFPLPDDYQEKAEFVFARLMYPDANRGGFGGFSRCGLPWDQGCTNWTNDYPRSDRHLMVAFRRLTRMHSRSVEQPVNLDDGDDVYNWPFLYAGRVANWNLTDGQVLKLRDFVARGGFFICDDVWGEGEWASLMSGIRRIFPEREVREIPDDDPMFHVVFDLDHRYQISGEWSLGRGVPYLNGGVDPHWRAVYDDEKKRIITALWYNNDTGDSWEWADDPRYPQRYSDLGIRIMVNAAVYGITH